MFELFKRKKPTDKVVEALKMSLLENMQEQLSQTLSDLIVTGTQKVSKKAYTTIFRNKRVELVTPDKKEEEDDQDRIYADIMSKMNGDRDIAYNTPGTIDITAFENDDMTPEERQEIYEIIDCINEANDIRRDGVYRTPESIEKEETESNRVAEQKERAANKANVADILMNMLSPILSLVSSMTTSIISLVIISKLATILDKF